MQSAKKIRTVIALLWLLWALGLVVSIAAAFSFGAEGGGAAMILALVSSAVSAVVIWVMTTMLQAVAEIVENTYITARNSILIVGGVHEEQQGED